ncbi:hypothetical protein NDU88_007199 [Pleurodeles waltl]|uniref:Uncharacterized protein n=1 Tax=Pleurodeles waltl TaxID=8319 RepID=A0AAV7M286_PLEWA|nr:hypothetical protein NDU88_007199 [Pleurodeles waltl]
MGPKDGCSVLVGALLYLGAHGPAPSSRARLGLAAVSNSGTRLRGPSLGARDREGPIHHGVTAGEGPVPDRRRPNPATHGSRLPRAERPNRPDHRPPRLPEIGEAATRPGSARAPPVTGAPPSPLGVPVGHWRGGEMLQGTGYMPYLVGRERSL